MAGLPPASGVASAPPVSAKAVSTNSQRPAASGEGKGSQDTAHQDWSSERQLALSLWKLQQLEAQVRRNHCGSLVVAIDKYRDPQTPNITTRSSSGTSDCSDQPTESEPWQTNFTEPSCVS
jgi:hypothetical protein